MSTPDPARVPVIVGVGQSIERDEQVSCIDLMERAATAALAEAPGIATRLDRLSTVNVLGDDRKRPASELAARLGLADVAVETTTVGGNTPQWLVTRTARAIADGEVGAALLAGGEAQHSGRRGAPTDRTTDEPPDPVVGVDRFGLSAAELAIGLAQPIHIYPMFESVRAADAGRTFAEHRAFVGQLMAPFTAVAAKHPYAWFPVERTAEDLATVTADNRLTAEPYAKRMNAIMAVDQGASLIVCSLAVARELGLGDRAVHIWSGADAADVWYSSARPELASSPAIGAAGGAALEAAGVGIDDMDHLDLYSCFPAAVQAGAEALGVALDDPRGLTVTGGLPYFGGPGNNYPMHAIATMVERLREGRGLALTTGLGWYITKHSVGIYGSDPAPDGFRFGDTSRAQAAIDASALAVVGADADGAATGETANGEATVDASTVVYDRDGGVAGAPVFARLDDGRRVVAQIHEDERSNDLAGVSLVGARIAIDGTPPTYRILTAGKPSSS